MNMQHEAVFFQRVFFSVNLGLENVKSRHGAETARSDIADVIGRVKYSLKC